jgi:hypothetical protein
MKFKETNNTSYKRIKEGLKEYDNYLLLMCITYLVYVTRIIVLILSIVFVIICLIFYLIYKIFNAIIKFIKDIFSEFLDIIKEGLDIIKSLISDDSFWSDLLADLQIKGYIKVEENTEDEHKQESE